MEEGVKELGVDVMGVVEGLGCFEKVGFVVGGFCVWGWFVIF